MVELKWIAAVLFFGVVATARADDDLESLDADFLSYLAEFEGEEDDWTIVESTVSKPASPIASEPVKPQPSTVSPPLTNPAPKAPAPEAGSER